MKLKLLDWDSSFFKKRVGELFIDVLNKKIDCVKNFDLLYVFSKEPIKLQINGFEKSYKEVKVVFSKELKTHNIIQIQNIYSLNITTKQDKDKIYSLAIESGKYSRFKRDKYFSENEFIDLYKKWIDNSFSKNIADEVLVFVENDIIIGFLTYKIAGLLATLGLIAVDLDRQGEGIGTTLLNYLENKLVELKVVELNIATQIENIEACSFYTKQGYSIKSKIYINHYWRL